MEKIFRSGVDLKGMYGKSFSGDSHFFEDTETPAKIRKYLDSSQEPDKLKGMKLLLAMLSKGKDVQEYFPDVVKNVVVKSIEVKKMVYIYLVHYADFDDTCREIALLSINSFQKDMSGTNPLIRGLALRVMTSIRVHDIIQIQLLAVRKCATDTSPYVRKCAANAIPKIFTMDPEQLDHLKQIIDLLLKDTTTMVLGSTIAAFDEVCPTDYSLLHRNLRKICHLLADMDEWTQVSALEVLTRYLRNQFTDPAPGIATAVKLQAKQRSIAAIRGQFNTTTIQRRVVKKAFYSDEEDESDEETIEISNTTTNCNSAQFGRPELGSVFSGENIDADGDLDPDHRLILKSSLPLLKSRNSAVVLAVSTLHYYCGTQDHLIIQQISKSLVRILRNRREMQYIVLHSINIIARDRPYMFRPYLSDFFIKATDPLFNRLLKLEILTSLSCKDNTQLLLRELQTYIKDNNIEFVCKAIHTIGQLADVDIEISNICMDGIMYLLLCTKNAAIICECVIVLRQLLQQNKKSNISMKILYQLSKLLIIEDGIEEPQARCSIVWLVGEFYPMLTDICPDVLRILAKDFIHESTETKTQILNLAIKLSLHLSDDENIQCLMTYILEMSRYDADTDLRDRSRFMTALMGLAPSNENEAEEGDGSGHTAGTGVDEDALSELNEHASGIMLAAKLPPVTLLGAVDVEGIPNFTFGSLSSIVGHNVPGYEPLLPWPDKQPYPTIRDALQYNQSDGSLSRLDQIGDAVSGASGRGNNFRRGSSGSTSSSDVNPRDTLKNFYEEKTGRSTVSKRSGGSDSDSSSDESGSDSDNSDDSSDSDSGTDSDATSSSGSSSTSSSSDSSGVAHRRHRQKHANTNKPPVHNSQMPVPFASKTSPTAAQQTSSQFLTANNPSKHVPTAGVTTNVSKSVTTMQGIRKVSSANRPKKDVFGNNSSVPLIASGSSGSLSKRGVNSEEDLVSMSASTSGGDLLADMAEVSSTAVNASPLLDNNLLMPTLRSSPLPTTAPAAATESGISSGPSSPMMPSMNNTVALSNGYTGLVNDAAIAAAAAGRPSVMLNHITTTPMTYPPPVPGTAGLGGNQRMMIQSPLAITQGAPGASLGPQSAPSGQQVEIYSTMPAYIPGENQTTPKVILKPEMGSGLSVSIVFRHGVTATSLVGGFCAYLILRNLGEHVLRRVKVSFPVDLRRSAIPDLAVLNPGQLACIPLELLLVGFNGKQVKADIRCDKGAYVGLLVIEDWNLLQPLCMSSEDFEILRARLGGFGELTKIQNITTLGLQQQGNAYNHGIENEIVRKVQNVLNIYLVQGAGVSELMLAGVMRKGLNDHKLLITILTNSLPDVCVKINCEDPVLCNGLGDNFFKLISS